jgi:flagellar motor component MotA
MNHSEFVEQYYKIVERALYCSQKARREGLLALEDDYSYEEEKLNERDIFEYGLLFVTDGTDLEIIRDILSNIIRQEKDEYIVKLKNIQLAAVLSIQAGDNPRIMYYRLNSFTDIPLNDEGSKKVLLSRGLL